MSGHAAVDADTNTVVNVSIWESEAAAKQMDTLALMLAQRPILEAAGVQFDKIANYEAAWKNRRSVGVSEVDAGGNRIRRSARQNCESVDEGAQPGKNFVHDERR